MTDLLDPRQAGRRSAPTLDPAPPARLPPGHAGTLPRPGYAYPRTGPAQDQAPLRGSPPASRWLNAHRTSLPVVLGLLVLGAWVLGTGIRHYPAFADDEGTYVAQAWATLSHGSLSHYTYWYDHPPLGWLQLAVGSWLLGPLLSAGTAVAQARSLMLLPALVGVALVYVLARRLGLRRPAAAGATVLFACSPLSVALLRQVYLDSVALPWLLASLVLALSPSRRLWAFAGSGLCFAIAVLTKETMLIFLPALVVAMVQNFDRRTRAFCLTAFLMALVLVVIGYPLYALLKGELLPGPGHVSLLQAMQFQLYGRPGTGSVLSSGSAAHQLVSSWLQTDPWLLGAGVCAAPLAVLVRPLRPVAAALLIAVLVALRGAYLPQPFVIALLPFCALPWPGCSTGWPPESTPATRSAGSRPEPWLLRCSGSPWRSCPAGGSPTALP
jgi:4-amino-4-deoxy-L-arabinose transferase-like glycosyltransferase